MYFDLLSHQARRRRRFPPSLSTERIRRRWRDSRAVILAVLSALVLVFGAVGFSEIYRSDGPLDSLYRAVQLFAFGGNVNSRPNLWLEVSRFLAPLVVGYAAIGVVVGLYREQFRWFRIRGLRDHVLVAGLGDGGFMMAAAFDRENWRVVVVERDASSARIQSAHERGIWVVQGDATDPHMLRRAGIGRAALLIAMCGDDGTNVGVATAGRHACHDRRRGILTTVVELEDFELWQIMKAQALVDRDHSAFRLELFNSRGVAAEMMLDDNAPFATEYGTDSHVLLVGLEGVGVSLAVEILKRWNRMRAPAGRRLRLTIADDSPEALVTQLLAAHPGIASIPGLQLGTWQVDVASLGSTDRVPPDVTSIYVCLATETRALTAALALRQHPGLWDQAPIVVAVADEGAGVGAAIARAGHTLDHVTAFGVLSRTLRPEALLRTATEKIARLGHEFHCRQQFERGITEASDPSLVRWEALSPDLRESNRLWADGIAAHLADLGLVVVPSPLMPRDEPAFEFADDEVKRLAPLEHARWENAMTRIGYRHGPTRIEPRPSADRRSVR